MPPPDMQLRVLQLSASRGPGSTVSDAGLGPDVVAGPIRRGPIKSRANDDLRSDCKHTPLQ